MAAISKQKLKAIARGMPGQKGVSGPVAGRRKPGKPCGKTFINADYLCSPDKLIEAAKRLRGTEDGRRYAEKVRAFKGLQKLRDAATTKTKSVAAKNAATAKSKDPQEIANEAYAKKWGKAWNEAPPDLKRAIDRTGKPREITSTEAALLNSSNAFHYEGGIHMAKYQPGDGRADAVWRHEYGHFLDYKMQDAERAKASPEIKRLKAEEEKLWTEQKGKSDGVKAKLKELNKIKDGSKRQREMADYFAGKEYLDYLEVDRTFHEKANKLRSEISRLQPAHHRSGKPDMLAAMDKDAKTLKSGKSKAVAREKKEFKAAIEDAYNLATGSYDWKKLRDAGLDMNTAENIANMGNKASGPAGLVKGLSSGKTGKSMMEQTAQRRLATKIVEDARKKKNFDQRAAVKDYIDEQVKTLSPIHKAAWERMVKDDPKVLNDIVLLEQTAYRLTSGNPDHLVAVIEKATGTPGKYGKESKGMLYDLTGSATKNAVGFGHSDSYYYNRERQSVETFANVVTLWGSGDPLEKAAAEYFTPTYTKLVQQAIKEM